MNGKMLSNVEVEKCSEEISQSFGKVSHPDKKITILLENFLSE
jgi:hypothetical protein